MEIKNIIDTDYLAEYVRLCSLEWGAPKTEAEMEAYASQKVRKIRGGNKVISVLGLMDGDVMAGFISLFKYDGEEARELTPWYATMYVKEEYRGKGLSRILNDAIVAEAARLGYDKIYLKTKLENYYEKFGAKFERMLEAGEKLYSIKCLSDA